MIDRAEIERKALEFEIHAANVQRDYVFGWLLWGLFTASEIKEQLFLKGGNALRKGYFPETRFSSDLDFGIPGDIDQSVLLSEINKVCGLVQAKAGVSFLPDDNRVDEKFTATDTRDGRTEGLRVYEARVYFKDFYGNADHIRIKISMDITRFDKVLLDLQTVPLIHPYSDASDVACNIRCMKLEEIIATKLKCLLQRQHAPDLFDYVYSVKLLGGNLDRNLVVQTFVRKTIFERNPHVVREILHKTPFDFYRECWDKTIICAKKVLFRVEEAVAAFLADLDGLFSIYPDNGYRQFDFFSADVRIPIMHAGRTQTVLKIRYNGADRIVEPYSLKYMTKRDGSEREYLYVYNRSGGNNPPGMRSLVAENLQSIENTEETFEPQHEIELSKAGEVPEHRYLFDLNKPARASRVGLDPFRVRRVRRPARATFGPKYVYQCTYCGKQSEKVTNNSSIRPHKNESGYPCPGRHGFYVTTKY